MAINRKQALANLANKLPTQNQQSLQNLQAAQRVQTRQQVAAAPQGVSMRAAQPLAAQQTAQAGQAAVQTAQQNLQQQYQIGQQALQQQGLENQADVFGREQRLQAAANANANKLAALSEDAKNQILDQRLKFDAKQAQQQYLNQRQLADWKIASARDKQGYMDAAQQATQDSARQIQVMETVYQRMQAALKRDYTFEGQKLDQKTKQQLQRMVDKYEAKIAKKKREAANNKAMWEGGGMIVGAVVGGIVGGGGTTFNPATAAGGAVVGKSAGTAISGT